MHYSVGALIERNGQYLLIDRAKEPFGLAGVAGHIDDGETPSDALRREVREEVGLEIITAELLFEEEADNLCSRGVPVHYWHLFKCRVDGYVKTNQSEVLSCAWYSPYFLNIIGGLEPIWERWLKELNILK